MLAEELTKKFKFILVMFLSATVACMQFHAKSSVITKKEQQAAIKAVSKEVERSGARDIIKKFSSTVVLIHTFSNAADDDGLIYNSAVKKRLKKHHYKHGVTSGVVLSEDGIIVTTYEGVMNSDEIIVSIDSDLKEITQCSKFVIGRNDYKAKVIKLIPELNLAFLKITPRKKETFQYIQLGNDTSLINDDKILKNGAIVIGKAKGENFVTLVKPANRNNNFGIFASFVEKLMYMEESGTPLLSAENIATGICVVPENMGGAVVDLKGKLIGLALYRIDNNSSLPSQVVIPVFIIKQGAKIAVPSLFIANGNTRLGIKVKNLGNTEIPQSVRKTIGIPDKLKSFGVTVDSVESKSVADDAGIQPLDILLKFNNKVIADAMTYNNLENSSFGETTIRLKILRNNKLIEIEINR